MLDESGDFWRDTFLKHTSGAVFNEMSSPILNII